MNKKNAQILIICYYLLYKQVLKGVDIMTLSVITTILEVILSFPYFLDIIIFLFLLISTSIGYAKGFWRGTFRFLFVMALLAISWFALLDTFANYVSNTLLSQLHITFKVGDYSATSIAELIQYSVKYAQEQGATIPDKFLNEAYMDAFVNSISKSIAWLFLVIIIQFVSWIISGILYFLIIRLIIPEKVRKVKLSLLGALMGLAQSVMVTFAFMMSFTNLSSTFRNIKSPGVGAFSWCKEEIKMIFVALDPTNSVLSPYVKTLEESLTNKQYNYEVEGMDGTFDLGDELKEFFELISSINVTTDPTTPVEPVEPDDNSETSSSSTSTSIPSSSIEESVSK